MNQTPKFGVKAESGQTTAEYAFILGGVCLVVATLLAPLAAPVQQMFQHAVNVF